MNDLTRTLADIAAAPVPPVKRARDYDGWHVTSIDGLSVSIPYRVLNKGDVDDMPEIELGPEREWRITDTEADLHASLRDDVSCEVDAMNISHAADRCDEREDR